MCSPDATIGIGKMGFLSPDSFCHSFDERANGYARGEGIASLVVKRLSDAVENGDTIRAVIHATATNSDGRTASIAQPNPISQEQLFRSTYQNAGLSTNLTRFVEAHGTGTAVGDVIEATALNKVFNDTEMDRGPVFV
jgi:acyl transferase domain-containing protein